MEEHLKILEEILKDIKADKNKACYVDRDSLVFPIIENLIARNKKLEDDLYATNCIVNEQIDVLRESIPKSKVKELLEKLDKEEKQELKGAKGQDRYFIKQIYSAKRSSIEDLLQERN